MKDDKLIRLSLQFFAEPNEDYDDDFDEYEDDEYFDDEENVDEDSNGEENEKKSDDEENSDGDDDEDIGADDGAEDDDGKDDTAALIAELKAAGYVGNDIKSLTADIKKKREDASGIAAAAERTAANKEGKGHIKAGKPSKSASGDGMAGFTHRDVEEMRRAIGPNCTEERARRALEKRIRANAR